MPLNIYITMTTTVFKHATQYIHHYDYHIVQACHSIYTSLRLPQYSSMPLNTYITETTSIQACHSIHTSLRLPQCSSMPLNTYITMTTSVQACHSIHTSLRLPVFKHATQYIHHYDYQCSSMPLNIYITMTTTVFKHATQYIHH